MKLKLASVALLAMLSQGAFAQAGVPVGIVTNPLGAVWHNAQLQQALATVRQLKGSYDQFQMYWNEARGITGLGSFLNSGIASAAGIPYDFARVYNGVSAGGYYGFTSAADAVANPVGSTSSLQRNVVVQAYNDAMANKPMTTAVGNALSANGVTLAALRGQIDNAPTMAQKSDLQSRFSAETAVGVNNLNRTLVLDMTMRNQKAEDDARRDAIGQRALSSTNTAMPNF